MGVGWCSLPGPVPGDDSVSPTPGPPSAPAWRASDVALWACTRASALVLLVSKEGVPSPRSLSCEPASRTPVQRRGAWGVLPPHGVVVRSKGTEGPGPRRPKVLPGVGVQAHLPCPATPSPSATRGAGRPGQPLLPLRTAGRDSPRVLWVPATLLLQQCHWPSFLEPRRLCCALWRFDHELNLF